MPDRQPGRRRPRNTDLRRPRNIVAWKAVVLLGMWGFPASSIGAEAPDDELAAQLTAGEFAPALERARATADPATRDAYLAQIAIAQSRDGDADASLATTSEIYDDRVRASTLRDIASQRAGRGGAAQADFDALIELIQSTIAPESWDIVGAPGSIVEFPGGVYVDTSGLLQRIVRRKDIDHLASLRARAKPVLRQGDVRRRSTMRHVSLTRLEKYVQLRLAAQRKPTAAMQTLAGIERVKYVFVYPESGDIVIVGPAGDWHTDGEGRLISTHSGRPVLRLDDLVVVLRHMMSDPTKKFGCSITPTQEALARTQTFLAASAKRPLRTNERDGWLGQLRSNMGKQDIEVFGIDPRTRVARVLVEADYRMKLVGMGLEEGTLGVTSYLDLVKVPPGEAPPSMNVLRWWFTLGYEAILTTDDHNAFEIRGQGVQVLSENELLAAGGRRVPTGASDELNQEFAQSFTTHFDALAAKYPIYAELQNIFDLALVAALIEEHDLPAQVGWHLTCFGDPESYSIKFGPAPQKVETVVNHRIINRRYVLAGVSGGVSVDPSGLVARKSLKVDRYGRLEAERTGVPKNLGHGAWWWD